MSASFKRESSFSVTKGANGVDSAGFFSALIKSAVAWVAAMAEEIPGILVFSGNNSTISAIRFALVLEM